MHGRDEFCGEALARGAVDGPAELDLPVLEPPNPSFESRLPQAGTSSDQPLSSSLWLDGRAEGTVALQRLVDLRVFESIGGDVPLLLL